MQNDTGINNTWNAAETPWTHSTNDTLQAWAMHTEIVYLSIVFLLGVPGNLLIIIVQLKNTNHSTTDYLVMSMAMYELYCSGFNAPIQILRNTRFLWPDIGSTFLCKFALFSKGFATTGSSLMLAAIAVDRGIKTCLPLNTTYDETQAKQVCVGLAITSGVMAAPYVVLFKWSDESAICKHASLLMLDLGIYYGMYLSALYFAAFFVMFVSYLNIIITLHRRHRRKLAQHKHRHYKMASVNGNTNRNIGTAAVPNVTVIEASTSYATTIDVEAPTMSDTTSYSPFPRRAATTHTRTHVGKPLLMEGRNLNKLTVIMFMISLLYMTTWIVNWVLYLLGPNILGVGMFFLSFSLPMINCSTNAVLFFAMSSRFRQNAKKLLCG